MVDLHTYLQTCCPWFPRLYNNSKYPLSLDCHHMQHTKHHNTVQWSVFLCLRLLQLFWLLFCLPASAGQCRPVQLGVGRAVENSPVTRATILQPACCTLDTEDSICRYQISNLYCAMPGLGFHHRQNQFCGLSQYVTQDRALQWYRNCCVVRTEFMPIFCVHSLNLWR